MSKRAPVFQKRFSQTPMLRKGFEVGVSAAGERAQTKCRTLTYDSSQAVSLSASSGISSSLSSSSVLVETKLHAQAIRQHGVTDAADERRKRAHAATSAPAEVPVMTRGSRFASRKAVAQRDRQSQSK